MKTCIGATCKRGEDKCCKVCKGYDRCRDSWKCPRDVQEKCETNDREKEEVRG